LADAQRLQLLREQLSSVPVPTSTEAAKTLDLLASPLPKGLAQQSGSSEDKDPALTDQQAERLWMVANAAECRAPGSKKLPSTIRAKLKRLGEVCAPWLMREKQYLLPYAFRVVESKDLSFVSLRQFLAFFHLVRDKARYDDKKYLLSYPELAASLPTPVLQKVYSAEELAALPYYPSSYVESDPLLIAGPGKTKSPGKPPEFFWDGSKPTGDPAAGSGSSSGSAPSGSAASVAASEIKGGGFLPFSPSASSSSGDGKRARSSSDSEAAFLLAAQQQRHATGPPLPRPLGAAASLASAALTGAGDVGDAVRSLGSLGDTLRGIAASAHAASSKSAQKSAPKSAAPGPLGQVLQQRGGVQNVSAFVPASEQQQHQQHQQHLQQQQYAVAQQQQQQYAGAQQQHQQPFGLLIPQQSLAPQQRLLQLQAEVLRMREQDAAEEAAEQQQQQQREAEHAQQQQLQLAAELAAAEAEIARLQQARAQRQQLQRLQQAPAPSASVPLAFQHQPPLPSASSAGFVAQQWTHAPSASAAVPAQPQQQQHQQPFAPSASAAAAVPLQQQHQQQHFQQHPWPVLAAAPGGHYQQQQQHASAAPQQQAWPQQLPQYLQQQQLGTGGFAPQYQVQHVTQYYGGSSSAAVLAPFDQRAHQGTNVNLAMGPTYRHYLAYLNSPQRLAQDAKTRRYSAELVVNAIDGWGDLQKWCAAREWSHYGCRKDTEALIDIMNTMLIDDGLKHPDTPPSQLPSCSDYFEAMARKVKVNEQADKHGGVKQPFTDVLSGSSLSSDDATLVSVVATRAKHEKQIVAAVEWSAGSAAGSKGGAGGSGSAKQARKQRGGKRHQKWQKGSPDSSDSADDVSVATDLHSAAAASPAFAQAHAKAASPTKKGGRGGGAAGTR
jgi:hypothetical protein